MNRSSNLSHANEGDSGTSPNSPVPNDETEATESDMNSSFDPNHANENDADSSNSTADEVICLSDSAHLRRHRPMHFDVISGGYTFNPTVIIDFYSM